MSSEVIVSVESLSKCYQIYKAPEDRLKQFVPLKFRELLGLSTRDYFQQFWAVQDVTFEIRRGEAVGIIGRNGSGKSTLLQMICGTLHPTYGQIVTNGRIAALLELGSGFNPEFSGRDNVYLNAALLGVSKNEIDLKFEDIASFADIGDFIDEPIKTYSSGMIARLAFATATNVEPDILVVDEALAVGDEAFQRKCFARIEEIKDRGTAILFVSHSTQMIVQLCNRVILMNSGIKILDGRPKVVVSQYERLANASRENREQIQLSIMSTNSECLAEEKSEITNSNTELISPQSHSAQTDTPLSNDYFDSKLQSESTIYSGTGGAEITQNRITTLLGKAVNNLTLGKRYVLEVDAIFKEHVKNVSFGMAIKNEKGLVLAGATNVNIPQFKIKDVAAGQQICVRIEFTCSLLPSLYFMGSTIYGEVGGESLVLNRVVDALLFRVGSESNLLAAGFFDLMPKLEWEFQ